MVSEIAGKDKAQSTDLDSGRISDFLRDSHLWCLRKKCINL